MKRHTKIVATLGPSTEDLSQIESLVSAGMDIARLNFSHGTEEQFKKIVKNIREVENKQGKTIVILQDLQGPKIRLGEIPGGEHHVRRGDKIRFFTGKQAPFTQEGVNLPLPYPALTKVVRPGQRLLIEDGLIRTKILSIKGNAVCVQVLNNGIIKSKKGVNIPDSRLPASEALTKKDENDLKFGLKSLGVDAVALSFVENKTDVERVRNFIHRYTKRPVKLIAKIERPKALLNLESIIDAADGIMVARGDLGIEIEAERVPIEQKRMIALSRKAGKPVIIATQILQSMVQNPLPTRAEVSDAANAIFDHADAFMLSNETAVGKYPDKAVRTLARVAELTEEAIFKNQELFPIPPSPEPSRMDDETMALNACLVADQINAEALVIMTQHGYTASTVIKHRPKNRILVVTDSIYTARCLHLFWGIQEVFVHKGPLRSEESIQALQRKHLLKAGSKVVSLKLADRKRSLVMMEL